MQSRVLVRFKKGYYNSGQAIWSIYFWVKYWWYLKSSNNSNGELFIFDLDNTLANTFPYLCNEGMKETYLQIPTHDGIAKIFNNCIASKKNVIILTARHFKYYSSTKKWVKKNFQKGNNVSIFLVPNAAAKLPFLHMAVNKGRVVTYYDDLSYNHENGKVKFYTDVIFEVEQLPITYIDYNGIITANST
jgi:hypothetical protein